jgi:phosphoglycerate dehydrogenase-like enzyme
MQSKVRIGTGPDPDLDWVVKAIRATGNEPATIEDCEGLIWTSISTSGLRYILDSATKLKWVQLIPAGIDGFREFFGDGRLWTSARGAYGEPVAEHALALILAGLRMLKRASQARSWDPLPSSTLYGKSVAIVGGGGIAASLIDLLRPFRVQVTVIRRTAEPIAGVSRVLGHSQLHEGLAGADVVVVALPLTPQTIGMFGSTEFAVMSDDAWLVNVARGAHVKTDDLILALRTGQIAGASLDVTDPEPLPEGHPLWEMQNCLITSHSANTLKLGRPHLVARITENILRYQSGQPLLGLVNPSFGY